MNEKEHMCQEHLEICEFLGRVYMYILGITASFSKMCEENIVIGDTFGLGHDASATLIKDGEVVCAIEEERLNRIKHTNKAPIMAMRCCLKEAGIAPSDIDAVAVNFLESTINLNFRKTELTNVSIKLKDAISYVQDIFFDAFDEKVSPKKIHFVRHHDAHAESAYRMSGFDECLCMVFDGVGDDSSGQIYYRKGNYRKKLDTFSHDNSLGLFYLECIKYLGYKIHDEYKVMGLAPYGDKSHYLRYFNKIVKLLPEGRYEINKSLYPIFCELGLPRRKNEEFSQVHMDFAASLQEILQIIIEHVVEYHVEKTGIKTLCLSGGVALNCVSNSNLLYKGIVKKLFVQPAAYDAGTSLGAALWVLYSSGYEKKLNQINDVYWGKEIDNSEEIEAELSKWKGFVEFRKYNNIESEVAELLAEGKVVGWVQGRSEFGPRALGNRSILADPRPAENKKRINGMVKKRESYRPFAPSVLEEKVDEYFILPTDSKEYPFMNTVLYAKKDVGLDAVVHVDGTARVQTVSKTSNKRYWMLINEFEKLTGKAVLLNTSFNNFAEPIVDSVFDAINSFLSTNIDRLVIGDYLISKKVMDKTLLYRLLPQKIPCAVVCKETKVDSDGKEDAHYFVRYNFTDSYHRVLREEEYEFMINCSGYDDVGKILENIGILERVNENTIDMIIRLWEERLIVMKSI